MKTADFNDSEGFPVIGGHCSFKTCGARDFLPSTCRFCKAWFCRVHAEPTDHDCEEVDNNVVGMQALICPACQETVRWDSANMTEAEALEGHKSCCIGQPKQQEKCPAVGCQEVLGFLNAYICPRCRQKVCLKHRYEDSHPCYQVMVATGTPCSAKGYPKILNGEERPTTAPTGSARRPAQPVASPQELRQLRSALEGTSADKQTCMCAIRRLLSDMVREPANVQRRLLERSNSVMKEQILNVQGADALLRGIGFEQTAKAFELPLSVSKGRIEVVMRILT
eukprot:gnl/MRDRNA2_/MRDRNA2_73754_c0_seq2.p1 gnl/MRDRNA2_/MRDRNA2_73754_c0~~gnl/MRDRNA2_/MRDRNA2_73754_c0_seq2.p1  ORF type:complete len:281 (-),score=42.47 gnl/MRDRNA2_/MRDRNA2_73754_c0_seq2:24-866(-)